MASPSAGEDPTDAVADQLETLELKEDDEDDTKKKSLSPGEKKKRDLWEK